MRGVNADTSNTSAIDVLYRIGRTVSNTEEPREALQLILNEIVAATNATSASIALINPDSNKLEIEAFTGLPLACQSHQPSTPILNAGTEQALNSRDEVGKTRGQYVERFALSLGQGITGWVALHEKPLIVNCVKQDARYFEIEPSIQSEMAVPMQTEGINLESNQLVTIGVVNINSEIENAFNEQDLKLLTVITQEATRVVNRIWLIKHLKIKNTQLETLIHIGQQLVKKLELQEVIDSITKQARMLMNCRICAFYLVNETGSSLRLYSLSSASAENLAYEEELQLEESSVGVVVRHNKQISIYDLPKTEEHHFIQLTQSENLCSLLATPVTIENKVIGVLNAYTDKHRRFNNDEKNIFATLATLGAVAIQNSNLYTRVFASEESLRKTERLTTLGLLASEIAHEIRNPLTVIKLLFDSLDLKFDHADARYKDALIIREKIKHLEAIVGNVLSFGKTNVELHARWELNQLIDDALRLVRLKMIQSKVAIIYTPPKDSIWIIAHKGQIQQVILNILFNALQAMPEGGEIIIDVGISSKSPTPHTEIKIKDSGAGISATIRDQIFDSFLTSKRDGTGLGLSISKQIMKQHRGDIVLVETSELGTTFKLTLPTA